MKTKHVDENSLIHVYYYAVTLDIEIWTGDFAGNA